MVRKSSPTKRATLEDVALAAGVGPMTVSRTINGHPYVSEKTAKKVRAAIRQLGYRPNHAARMLTGQLSRSIGLIFPADIVQLLLEKAFTDSRAGIPGNDDSAAMSSWLIFQTLGFYPVAGQDVYLISTPNIPDASLTLASGKSFGS